MRRITATCLLLLSFSVLHNIYLFNTENDEADENWNTFGSDDGGNLVSRFVASSVRRVKRRIFYRNESLPEMDVSVFGNRTGRNNTIALIKLLNKHYYINKKRYYEILANKSMKPPPLKFSGRDFLAKKKAEEAAKKAKAAATPSASPAPNAAGAGGGGPTAAPAGGGAAPAAPTAAPGGS